MRTQATVVSVAPMRYARVMGGTEWNHTSKGAAAAIATLKNGGAAGSGVCCACGANGGDVACGGADDSARGGR